MDQKKIIKSTGILTFATSLSRIFGLVRESVFAYFLGTSPVAAAFIIAFKIPNLLRTCFAEGALSASFIPTFTDYLTTSTQKEISKMVNAVLNALIIFLIGITLLGIFFSPLVVRLITLNNPPDSLSLVINLTRLMFPYIFFVSIAALFMGVLNSYHHFFMPALGPLVLNVMIVFSFYFICPFFNQDWNHRIYGVGIGVLLGGLGQILIQFPALKKIKIKYNFCFNFSHPALKKISHLMIPSIIGLGVTQINFFVDTMLACKLGAIAITGLNYGNRIIQFPLGLIGVSIANVNFPVMAQYASSGKIEKLKQSLFDSLNLVFFISLPITFGLMILSKPIIRLIFERGAFDTNSTMASVQALFFYSIGLFAYMAVKNLVTVFYSLKDTKTPLKIGIIALVSNIILNLILMVPLKHGGLALATAFSSFINMIGLFFFLRKKIGNLGIKKLLKSFFKFLFLSLIMGIICFIISFQVEHLFKEKNLINYFLKVAIPLIMSIFVYIILCFIFKVKEIKMITSFLPIKNRFINND
ncbi:MAG: murein biosynthesis integral membrane protein MurJ [bacterium]